MDGSRPHPEEPSRSEGVSKDAGAIPFLRLMPYYPPMESDDPRDLSRRRFVSTAAATSFAAALGLPLPFGHLLPRGLIPVALAAGDGAAAHGKPGLTLLGDRPLNLETPPHLLDDDATPAARMFVRNNGHAPDPAELDPGKWALRIDGEVENPLNMSIADLNSKFEVVTFRLQMECGGNGRKFFHPAASGNKWTFGAIACPDWTGVRLADVLKAARPTTKAVYTGHYGLDRHLSGEAGKDAISRGVPMAKAMEPHSLIAFEMNGEPMPLLNGAPLRLVIPGWPGSCSQKWLTRIWVRNRVHDGEHMLGQSYRVPAYPVAPGAHVPDEDMRIIESMPVRSIATFPETGARTKPGAPFEARGHAWAGDRAVSRVDVSIDFGATWKPARLDPPKNRYAWQRWRAEIALPEAGYYEVWARATDDAGVAQPPVPPGWNPKGYLNNMQHRIAVFAL